MAIYGRFKGRMMTTETRTVELYNLIRNGRAVGNGWLVRVVKNGHTEFVRFGSDEQSARLFAVMK